MVFYLGRLFATRARIVFCVIPQASAAGSFFARFPRWRQLISINKPLTGGHQLDFVFRQDWNSLSSEHSTSSQLARSFNYSTVPCLRKASIKHSVQGAGKAKTAGSLEALVSAGAPACVAADYSSSDERYTSSSIAPGLRFTEVAGENNYYPHADLLHSYINHWASGAAPRGSVSPLDPAADRALKVTYNTTIVSVSRPPGYREALAKVGGIAAAAIAAGIPRFRLTSADGRVFDCVTLVWASGMTRLSHAEGVNVAEMAENYWTHSTDVEAYRNKSVLIIGRGNAAFEVANHILGITSLVHVIGRDTARIRLSTEVRLIA